jgi:hypothetical protein
VSAVNEPEDKQLKMAQNLQQMMRVTKKNEQDDNQRKLASQFMQMMETTRKIENDSKQKEWAEQFAKMMSQTRSFDSEHDRLKKAGESAISDAFARMMHITHKLEEENKNQFEFPPDVDINHFPSTGDKFFQALIKKLPKRIQRFPQAFRRNPRAVIKYFLAMVVGRILAITLYVIAAFIPALPIPESVSSIVGKSPGVLGSALSTMRGAVVEFSPQAVIATVSTIPTDINKLLQKVGEFFQYYGRRAGIFLCKAVRNPKWAAKEIWKFLHQKGPLLLRLGKGTLGVAFSFFVIKLAMIFLLPLFGGIAITVLGFNVSIILLVVVKMAVSTCSEILGRVLGQKFIVMSKYLYNHPEEIVKMSRILMGEWMQNWVKENEKTWFKDEEKNKK